MELKNFEKQLKHLVSKVQADMEDNLTHSGKGNSNLIKNLDIVIKETDDGYQIQDKLPDYAIFVDKGRKAGKQPPISSIEEWCKRKSIPKSASFAIARNIGKNGIPATNFMKTLRKLSDIIVDKGGKYIAEDLIIIFNKEIEEINN
jgi:hypothetical protein